MIASSFTHDDYRPVEFQSFLTPSPRGNMMPLLRLF